MTRYTVQLSQGGTFRIPTALQKLYHLDAGDTFTLLDIGGAFVLSPQNAIVPKLSAEIEKLRQEAGVTLDEILESAYADRGHRTAAGE